MSRDLAQHLEAWTGGDHDPGRAAAVLDAAEALRVRQYDAGALDPDLAERFLEATGTSAFLSALPDRDARHRWAATTEPSIEAADYTLGKMIRLREEARPDHQLLRASGRPGAAAWSYRQVAARLRTIAAVLLEDRPVAPRVALLVENGVDGACCDLACLAHGIFVSPVNPHTDEDTLAWILDRIRVDVAITDSEERRDRLLAVGKTLGRPLRVLVLDPVATVKGAERLDAAGASLTPGEIDRRLAAHAPSGMHDLATVMFTSGSTGRPKGVAFSGYNLVTKRFARAAALPDVGRDEVLLSYLPLFHTFGRYLELLGTIYWGGTYVFAENPSAETLLAEIRHVRPTGLISIPLRWQQIRERCLDAEVRDVIGDRLRWGLSAAGYLEPRVFRFFHRHGVALCSGFGMTEATGGITMTPPDEYRDGSVGIALPGIRERLSEEGELSIAGPYVARYLADDPADDPPDDGQRDEEHWLPTGDLFRRDEAGHLEIVDRIKDIYKNTKGQTIAPRRVEQQFAEVPGIRRTFLVGDGRSYNTLLVVPDREDPVLRKLPSEDAVAGYFHQIVTTANRDLAAFERVVDFALLDRDLDAEHGELTPKGSFRRKAIVANFEEAIRELYRRAVIDLQWEDMTVRIPRWFFRDLGILDSDVVVEAGGLLDRVSGRRLPLNRGGDGRLRVGDLEYTIGGERLDLGLFIRQPLLWAGNPTLAAFGRCRPGWDHGLGDVSEQVFLPERESGPADVPREAATVDAVLGPVDRLFRRALFGDEVDACDAVDELEERLAIADDRLSTLIRLRLEALATHPDLDVRSRAYRILLLDDPVPDYSRHLPAFIRSGRPFLSRESINAIGRARMEPRRLLALRRRMEGYRRQLSWPATPETRGIFEDLLRLMADFARHQPEFYATVREELASWLLHRQDPELARTARLLFEDLAEWFETRLAEEGRHQDPDRWEGRIAFQEGLTDDEVRRIQEVFVGTTFLDQSVRLAYDGEELDLDEIDAGGIWVSRVQSHHDVSRYRVSVNTRSGKHFDLQLIMREDLDELWVLETIYWYIAIHGHPSGAPVLPSFGCCRPELGAISLAYVSDLTVWERIRQLSSVRGPSMPPPTRETWRRLFVAAVATVFRAWDASGRRILPGLVGPENVVVREPDIREGHRVLALTGWRPFLSPVSLVRPILQNFYRQTASHFPWIQDRLDPTWILDAAIEALGDEEGTAFLEDLRDEIQAGANLGSGVAPDVGRWLEGRDRKYHRPLPLRAAIDRYHQWERLNSGATGRARVELLDELQRLYRLDRLPEIARYVLYRNTAFATAAPVTREAFDRLLERMAKRPDERATRMVELSDVQTSLTDPDDVLAFRRMAFPGAPAAERVEVLTVGDRGRGRVIVRSTVTDRQGETFSISEPTQAAEVGQVYRLFLLAGFPKTVSEKDRFLVVTDSEERIIGGVCYHLLEGGVVHLDGIVVTRTLLDRGITSALLEDFCGRMADLGNRVVKTHFLLRRFYLKRGFRVDRRWGGLVRDLAPDEDDALGAAGHS